MIESQSWITATTRCRLCGHEQVSCYPSDVVDDTRLECGNCGHMACEPVEGDE